MAWTRSKKRRKVKLKPKKLRRARRSRKVKIECTILPSQPKIVIDENQTMGNKVKFQDEVRRIMTGGLTAMEAIQEYCEIHNLEPESIPKLLTPNLLDELYSEAREYNLIKRVNTVPL